MRRRSAAWPQCQLETARMNLQMVTSRSRDDAKRMELPGVLNGLEVVQDCHGMHSPKSNSGDDPSIRGKELVRQTCQLVSPGRPEICIL